MIVGLGTDIVQIPRIEALLRSSGERFRDRVFTKAEQEYCESRADARTVASAYAKRFAAKEAFAKAVGTGFGEVFAMIDVEVVKDARGVPSFRLVRGAELAVQRLVRGRQGQPLPPVLLSLSDDYPVAMAVVVVDS